MSYIWELTNENGQTIRIIADSLYDLPDAFSTSEDSNVSPVIIIKRTGMKDKTN